MAGWHRYTIIRDRTIIKSYQTGTLFECVPFAIDRVSVDIYLCVPNGGCIYRYIANCLVIGIRVDRFSCGEEYRWGIFMITWKQSILRVVYTDTIRIV